jgi:RND family efflux transporter MFP subunit
MTRSSTLALSALILFLSACSKEDKKTVEAARKPDLPVVKTAVAASRRVDKTISVTGSLNPDETVNVSFEVAGRITAIHADFGHKVRKGDVLAELDRTEYQFQVDRTRAALNQAMARLGLRPGQDQTPPESTPAMRQAQAQTDDARFKYENAQKLFNTGDISRERFTELEKAYYARQAAYEVTRDDMRMQWATIQSTRADLDLAEKHLRDTVVRAPFDGAVTQKAVSMGQYIRENTTVLTIVKANPLRLLVDIPESATGSILAGSTLTFTTDAIPDRRFRAVVGELNPSLDAKSRSLTAEARLGEADARLRPGMFVQVQLVTARNADIVVIPSDAIYTVAGLAKVFVIRDGHALERHIPPGKTYGDWIEVPADQIGAGETVAVSNLAILVNGAEVAAPSL